MDYKQQAAYLENVAFLEVGKAILDMREQGLIRGKYISTRYVSDYIYENAGKYPRMSHKRRKHLHEVAGVFIMRKLNGEPYNKQSRTHGGRVYVVPAWEWIAESATVIQRDESRIGSNHDIP